MPCIAILPYDWMTDQYNDSWRDTSRVLQLRLHFEEFGLFFWHIMQALGHLRAGCVILFYPLTHGPREKDLANSNKSLCSDRKAYITTFGAIGASSIVEWPIIVEWPRDFPGEDVSDDHCRHIWQARILLRNLISAASKSPRSIKRASAWKSVSLPVHLSSQLSHPASIESISIERISLESIETMWQSPFTYTLSAVM